MLWISLAVIVVFGSLTIWLQNEMFIKWKPSILYWIFGGILLFAQCTGRNYIRKLLSTAEIVMNDAAWNTLQKAWIAFSPSSASSILLWHTLVRPTHG